MDTIICGETAFDYWRIPPIVQLLLTESDDDRMLLRYVSRDSLAAFRAQAAQDLALCRKHLVANKATRGSGQTARQLGRTVPLLAANHSGPIDVLTTTSIGHASTLVRAHGLFGEITPGMLVPIADDTHVTSAEFTLQQLVTRIGIGKTVMLGEELCGSFAVYKPPGLVRTFLQSMIDRRVMPRLGGWAPFVDANGRLSDLWTRPPLTSPHALSAFAARTGQCRGRAQLAEVASLIVSNAASPFEARVGILLGFSRRRGGEGYGGFRYNQEVSLSRDARLLAQRRHCRCDLYWEDAALDLECQSSLVHEDAESYLSDSNRTAALGSMGINVLPVTYERIKDAQRFEALSKMVARSLGVQFRKKTDLQSARHESLRKDVFANWESLHRL